ncbi:hypothetical protein SCA03_48710 [Streptomyces cacaoi]|uniref:Uncharacterized protein n=1 Tax=Streptomyces cacaoi TaxID=1898 RepID=A0A4Y3R912_STRCI|nr:hypothetical protein SCA03_48710 [Streptomyces cacaoi]
MSPTTKITSSRGPMARLSGGCPDAGSGWGACAAGPLADTGPLPTGGSGARAAARGLKVSVPTVRRATPAVSRPAARFPRIPPAFPVFLPVFPVFPGFPAVLPRCSCPAAAGSGSGGIRAGWWHLFFLIEV